MLIGFGPITAAIYTQKENLKVDSNGDSQGKSQIDLANTMMKDGVLPVKRLKYSAGE
ncbi:MAG: hypothetical protein MI717_09925 [Spirochaetales bacterium]|nr:hypothetical protein [Spirochaetales bacterium]